MGPSSSFESTFNSKQIPENYPVYIIILSQMKIKPESMYSKRHTKSSIHLNLEGSRESVLRLEGAGDVSNTLLLDR